MRMLEIIALDNGAHRNQSYHGVLPDGWAIIPEGMGALENFPFGDVEVADIGGVPVVAKWRPGIMPEPKPDPEAKSTLADRVDELEEALNMILTGVTE